MATRALVLGGGGPVGIAWESGLIAGLEAEGVKYFCEMFCVGSGEFDKFEAVEAHGIFVEIWHESLLRGT